MQIKKNIDMERIYQENSDDWDVSAFEVARKLKPRVKEYFDKQMEEIATDYLTSISACESPIEQLLGLALKDYEKIFNIKAELGVYTIDPQYEIECFGKKYRVDFYITAMRNDKLKCVIVECDGYDFHEKTKEQATRDKQRDRFLTKAGYTVIRFTGSEIWDNPQKCVREIIDILFSN